MDPDGDLGLGRITEAVLATGVLDQDVAGPDAAQQAEGGAAGEGVGEGWACQPPEG